MLLLALAMSQAHPQPAVDNATSSDPAALIARLAHPAPARTAYSEVRFVRMLRKPLVLHGELEYGGAERLGKTVTAPYRETMTIADGNVVVQREGRGERKFALDRAPELQALLSGFSALLGGDAATVQKNFTLQLVDNAQNWTLTMTPSSAALSKHLRDMVVDGAANEPRCFTLHESSGETSIMLIGALAAAKLPDAPSAETVAALCRATP
jgi:hypothetical protein